MYFKVNTLLITNSSGKLAGKSTVSERPRPQGHHFPPQLIAQLPTYMADICCVKIDPVIQLLCHLCWQVAVRVFIY